MMGKRVIKNDDCDDAAQRDENRGGESMTFLHPGVV